MRERFDNYGRAALTGSVLVMVAIGLSLAGARRTEGTVAAAVQVVNTMLPVETENDSRIPYEQLTDVHNGPGSAVPGAAGSAIPAVPANKKLIIEFVSGVCDVEPGSDFGPIVLSTITTDGLYHYHYFTPTFVGNYGALYSYGISQQTHLLLLPGEGLSINGVTGQYDCGVELSGELLNQ